MKWKTFYTSYIWGGVDNVGEVEEVEEQEGGSTRKYKRWAGRNNYTLTQWLRHR